MPNAGSSDLRGRADRRSGANSVPVPDAAALAAAPEAFPAADRSFTEVRFWPIQVVLVCVAVAGTAIVDCVRTMLTEERINSTALAYFLWLLLFFFIKSIMFSVTLLASQIGWDWLIGMAMAGALIFVPGLYFGNGTQRRWLNAADDP